jgi:hypothetical protein
MGSLNGLYLIGCKHYNEPFRILPPVRASLCPIKSLVKNGNEPRSVRGETALRAEIRT